MVNNNQQPGFDCTIFKSGEQLQPFFSKRWKREGKTLDPDMNVGVKTYLKKTILKDG
ncbi:hypothetical protein KAJ27_04280 [bacterium]|nr:hypothetical protein [bacterium]